MHKIPLASSQPDVRQPCKSFSLPALKIFVVRWNNFRQIFIS